MIAYKLGEADAFAELYSRHAPRIWGFLYGRLENKALAGDIFQSTFLKLHRFRARYDATFPFLPWLFTICRSEFLDALKKSHLQNEILVDELPDIGSVPELRSSPDIDLSGLSDLQKQAVELRYVRDFSFEQIAERLDTTSGNARKLVSRAIRNLRGTHGKR